MKEIFRYQKNPSGVSILGLSEELENMPETLLLPEEIKGRPVTELAAYAFFDCRFLREAVLPASIHSVGAHCFYDCRGLGRISLWEELKEIGDGAFKNCMELHEICYNAPGRTMGGLKGILSELNQSFDVAIRYGQEEMAKLVFPRYVYDYEENTMARIINQVTYGCGVHYRECLTKDGVDYEKYDRLFSYAVVNGQESETLRTAVWRVLYPYCLKAAWREAYQEYLLQHWEAVLEGLFFREAWEEYSKLLMLPWVSKQELSKAQELARKRQKHEWTAYALTVKRKRFARQNARERFAL